MNQTTPQREAAVRDVAALPADRAQKRAELAEMTFEPGQMFQPRNGRELMDMANLMSQTGQMVKEMYRGNPGQCMALIAICAPYGLNPIMVSWKTYQTKADGPVAYEAQLIMAMLNTSGAVPGGLRYRFEGEGQDRRCIAYARLPGDDEPVEVLSPRLADINPKNSPLWKSDPDQQLCYYTGRAWARRYKPEMFLGIYTTDEVEVARGPAQARDITPGARPAPKRGGVVYIQDQPAEAVKAEPVHDDDGVILDAQPETADEPGQPSEAEVEATMQRIADEVRTMGSQHEQRDLLDDDFPGDRVRA